MASSKNRKAAALALAVVGVAGLSIASAAQLNVGSASLGAGQSVVASCQPTTGPAIKVGFENTFATGSYKASKLVLSDVAAACAGLNVKVTLTGAGGAAIGSELTTTAVTGSTPITLPNVDAAAITGVSVVIFS